MNAETRTLRARQFAAALCGGAALLAAVLAVWLGLGDRDRSVSVLGDRGEPAETAARFFHALCLHEWGDASSYVRGRPALDLGSMPEDALERDLWETYLLSWAWSMGDGGVTGPVSAWQEVNFTCLRPDVFTSGLDDEVKEVLARWVNERPLSEMYTAEGEFREDVVRAALEEAVRGRLARPEQYLATTTVRLELAYESGRWVILPEDTLWNALAGVPEGGAA